MAAGLVVTALDGEPLVWTARHAALAHAAQLVRAAERRGAEVAYVIGRGADDVRAALAAAGVAAGAVHELPEVIGCDDAAFVRRSLASEAVDVVHAADLAAPAGQVLLTVAGAVGSPGARLVDASARVTDVIAAAGGASCGPAWVALATTLRVEPPLERDLRVGERPGLRAIIVAPGGSTLARRARGDLRALDVASPLGVDRAWLGAFDANAAARSPLSIALVTRRLGFAPGDLRWPTLASPDALE
jgi:hypothetical protein